MSFAANMYLYLAEGFVICVTNSTLLWCIFSDRRNRKRREFILVGAQSLADLFYAIAFMLIANLRLGIYFENKLTATVPTNECSFLPALWLHNIATPLLGLIPITISVNFLACSVVPLWYLRATHAYTFFLLLAPFTITAILVSTNAILLIDAKGPISALCIAANGAAHPVVYHIMLFFRIAANLGSAVIYAIILIYLKRNQGGKLKELTPQQLKMHRNAKITLGLVTLNSMILLFFPDILLFFNPWNITKNYSTPLYSLTLSKTMANFLIYMCRYRELRNIILSKFLGCMPERYRSTFSRYLQSKNEASTAAPKSAFATRSSVQFDREKTPRAASISSRKDSLARSRSNSINAIQFQKNRILPIRPMEPKESGDIYANRLPPISSSPQ